MRHLLISPMIISLPEHTNELTDYLGTLSAWLRVLKRRPHECSVSKSTINSLWLTGRYPTLDKLKSATVEAQITDYTPIDIMNSLRNIVDREPYLESHTKIKTVVCENDNIEPASIFDNTDEAISTSFRGALWIAGTAKAGGWSPSGVCVAVDPQCVVDDAISLTGNVCMVEYNNDEIEYVDILIDESFSITADPTSIDRGIELADIYKDVSRATEYVYAELGLSRDHSVHANIKVTAGPEFIETLEKLAIPDTPSVLHTVFARAAFALAGRLGDVNGATLHPVRQTKAPESAQVRRDDGALLWRCCITKRGAGYRLHYWCLPDGSIELDKVMVESDVVI